MVAVDEAGPALLECELGRPHERAVAEDPQVAARNDMQEPGELHYRFNAPRTSAADATDPPERSIASRAALTQAMLLSAEPKGASSSPTRTWPPRFTAGATRGS